MMSKPGLLLVISGPSGAGKSTVIRGLLACGAVMGHPLRFSISATTRLPRPGEQDGVEYHFITEKAFETLVEAGGFLEYAGYAGRHYGTPRAEVERHLTDGTCIILDIEVQGALQVKARQPDAVLVFLMPPSLPELERRLRERKSEDEQKILRRLDIAQEEFRYIREYNYIVCNNTVEEAAGQLAAIIQAEYCRVERQLPVYGTSNK